MGNFLAGLAIGYVAGTMLAPTPGDELRAGIVDRISRLLPTSEPPHEAVSALAHALNHASEKELLAVRGIGRGLARKIVRHRPYRTGNEILQSKIVPQATFGRVKEEFT